MTVRDLRTNGTTIQCIRGSARKVSHTESKDDHLELFLLYPSATTLLGLLQTALYPRAAHIHRAHFTITIDRDHFFNLHPALHLQSFLLPVYIQGRTA